MDMNSWLGKLHVIQQEFDEEENELEEEAFIMQLMYHDISVVPVTKRGGSRPGRAANLDRNRQEGAAKIERDYFCSDPVYNDRLFRRRFRMRKTLFLQVVAGVSAVDEYFQPKKDALGIQGLSTLQKVIAAHRQLCYGVGADAVDEYLRIGESTAMKCLHRFCKAVVSAFGTEFLREPLRAEIEQQLQINAARGFPGMFGSLDCTHWNWKNCPVSWQGQYQDRKKNRSIILEALCTEDLRIWHWYFGMPGSNNDINVIDRSPLLGKLFHNSVPEVEFTVNRNIYRRTYLLADGIYPDMPVFMKTISQPQGEKRKHYALVQEAVRKDIERCFGVLKARFALLCNPSRLWKQSTMQDVMRASICLHNMICADEYRQPELDHNYLFDQFLVPQQESALPSMTFEHLRTNMLAISSSTDYYNLRNDLVEHLWHRKGNQN